MSFKVGYKVSIRDIINNLSSYSGADLNLLANELSEYVDIEPFKDETLYDEMKKTAIMELNELMSLDDINLLIKNKRN